MTFLLDVGQRLLSSPALLAATAIGLVAAYFAGVIVYSLALHSLAKYPGPLLAKLTNIHLAYHAWKGDRHLHLARCHAQYGSPVRVGPSTLAFNTSTALKSIYGFKAPVRKSDFYKAFPATPSAVSVHSAIDKGVHARKRRVIAHAFSDAAIKEYERYIMGNVATAVRVLREGFDSGKGVEEGKGWSNPINAAPWADYLAFDIMGDLAFGKAFGMLTSPTDRFATTLVQSAAHRHLICGTHLPIHNLHLDALLFPHIAASRARYMAYSRSQSAARAAQPASTRRDFFHHLLAARDPETGAGFSSAELWGESNLLIIAGSDTTSTALAATIHFLAYDPVAQARVADEVRKAWARAEDIGLGRDLAGCRFLRACIDEAMRLAPPVPGALPRTVLGAGMEVDGCRVPGGVDVCVPHYALHRNGAYFPEPDAFVPGRWLGEVYAEYLAEAQGAFAPFSIGPRGCVGKGLAYAELGIAVARVVWEVELRGVGGGGDFGLRDTFTSVKDGPVVQVRLRA